MTKSAGGRPAPAVLAALRQRAGRPWGAGVRPASWGGSLLRWHGLADWIATGNTRVYVPYAKRLASAIPPIAVRLRRDFSALLGLIGSHALLHRATRHWVASAVASSPKLPTGVVTLHVIER